MNLFRFSICFIYSTFSSESNLKKKRTINETANWGPEKPPGSWTFWMKRDCWANLREPGSGLYQKTGRKRRIGIMKIQDRIIRMAVENGATLAGIADMDGLRVSPSHRIYEKIGRYPVENVGKDYNHLPDNEFIKDHEAAQNPPLFSWPRAVKSVLVIGLSHPKDQPELDWWDGRGTPGNRILIDIIKRTSRQIEEELKVNTRKLHYYVEKGGFFSKMPQCLPVWGVSGKTIC